MSAVLTANLHDIIVQRFQTASLRELIDLLPSASNSSGIVHDIKPRFEIIDDDQAFDHSTGLIWLRDHVPGGKRPWKESITAAEALNVGGYKWRAPTIREQLSIVDYDRHDPAFDTDVFRGGPHWVWTSTPLHSSPSGCAWGVDFSSGGAFWGLQSDVGFVRAVRVGQF